eukprot:6782252-Heterocapsa_arctica.AAC.1
MGGQGRGVEDRYQISYEAQQPGTEHHQRGTGSDLFATGTMENQGEGRVQEGNDLPSTEDRPECEGVPEEEIGNQESLFGVRGDRMESGSVGRRCERWGV